MGDTLHLITVYSKTTAKAWFQYRVDAFLKSLAVFLREATGIIVIYFTLLKFDTLSGWNIYEMLFLFSLLFLTYGIMIIFFTGLRDFGKTVRDGSFDRFMWIRKIGQILERDYKAQVSWQRQLSISFTPPLYRQATEKKSTHHSLNCDQNWGK